LKLRDWELLTNATTALELPHREIPTTTHTQVLTESLLEDLQKYGVDLTKFGNMSLRKIASSLYSRHSVDELRAIFTRLGPDYERVLSNFGLGKRYSGVQPAATISTDTMQVETPATPIVVDADHSRYVEEFWPKNPSVSPLVAYSRFEAGVAKGKYPTPTAIGRLINGLGRLKEMEKVRTLYNAAQLVISTLEAESRWQATVWFNVEDQMIIACAHAGEMETAFEHRQRITAQGGTPSPDAYGSLIECVKDTTDDTSNAVALYRESQVVGCTPNVYLFDTIISKLAKARKADFALGLFQEMKAIGIRPSSITYGAVIGACARVGDAMSAEQLFLEMSEQPNFKPRIPPFNTMMQLYSSTIPNRERVLHYYSLLEAAQVLPSGHTYKVGLINLKLHSRDTEFDPQLLLDAYGTIEPVDVRAMEAVFQDLVGNRRVPVQGPHWASLINSWGCVQKNFDKAIDVFESIAAHPSSKGSSGPMPDAVVYEALINVLVTHRRMDLVSSYIERLHASGIHLTAYIANLLIKGHAAVGDMAQARAIFETLEDPPQGMAATSNHLPHSSSLSIPTRPAEGPCHREVSFICCDTLSKLT